MAILANIRLNPTPIVKTTGVRTGQAKGSFVGKKEGGRCFIAEFEAGAGVVDLKATDGGGTDFFVPWVKNSYGFTKVPTNVPNGTIVISTGLNGCSLVVTQQGNNFIFYHDGDSKYCQPGNANLVGNEIARFSPDEYDPGDVANKSFAACVSARIKNGGKPEGDLNYGSFIIFVRNNGQWIAATSSVISVGKLLRMPGEELGRF